MSDLLSTATLVELNGSADVELLNVAAGTWRNINLNQYVPVSFNVVVIKDGRRFTRVAGGYLPEA